MKSVKFLLKDSIEHVCYKYKNSIYINLFINFLNLFLYYVLYFTLNVYWILRFILL